MGEATALALAQHFRDPEALRDADEDEIQRVPDVGPVVAKNIRAYFDSAENRMLLKRLLASGVHLAQARAAARGGRLRRQDIRAHGNPCADDSRGGARCDPGARREGERERVEEDGYLIAGADPGSKLAKALELGVEVLDEAGFAALLKSP